MTKPNNFPVPSARDIVNGIEHSPYFKVACVMMKRRGISDPNIGDILEAFHEIAKVDHKLNNKEK